MPVLLIIVAGDRGDGTPVADRSSSVRRLRNIGVQGNGETVAVCNDNITHPWPLVKPQLFAEVILA